MENTPEQIAAHEANEKRAEEEMTWDVYEVILTSDPVEWEPRNNPDFWHEETNEDGVTNYVPNEGQELSESGKVVMPGRARVVLRAKNEEMAKMIALRAEEANGYHTVESVNQLG